MEDGGRHRWVVVILRYVFVRGLAGVSDDSVSLRDGNHWFIYGGDHCQLLSRSAISPRAGIRLITWLVG